MNGWSCTQINQGSITENGNPAAIGLDGGHGQREMPVGKIEVEMIDRANE
jgi:hypothetical protein